MSSQSLTTFALIALMAVAFYFLILRPQKKRQQEQQKTMSSITPGARVMTGSGLFGTVVSVGEKQIVVEVSPGVNLTLLKPAVSRVVGPDDEDAPTAASGAVDYGAHSEPGTTELNRGATHTEAFRTDDLRADDPRIDQPRIDQTRADDLGPSATDVTPGRTQSQGNDPSTKE